MLAAVCKQGYNNNAPEKIGGGRTEKGWHADGDTADDDSQFYHEHSLASSPRWHRTLFTDMAYHTNMTTKNTSITPNCQPISGV